MTEPFNLDAVLGLPFTFTFDGDTYTLPVDVDWDTAQMLGDGKPAEAIRSLLGEDQWKRLEDSPKVFGTKSFTAILDAYMGHLGLRAGGIGSLVAILGEHGGAIEADLQRYYRIRLSDLGRPPADRRRLTWRRLAVLLQHLPRESALSRTVNGPTALWGDTEHLLAFIGDNLAGANWQRGGGKGPRPKPLPRPGVEDRNAAKVRRASRPLPLEEAAGFFKAWREGAFAKAGDN